MKRHKLERYMAKRINVSNEDVTLHKSAAPFYVVECWPSPGDNTCDTIYVETDGIKSLDPAQDSVEGERFLVVTDWTFIAIVVVRNPNNPDYFKKSKVGRHVIRRWKKPYREAQHTFIEHVDFTEDAVPGTIRSCIAGNVAA